MSSPQIDHESSASPRNRLLEAVSESPDDFKPGSSFTPSRFDELQIALIGPGDEARNNMAKALVAVGCSDIHAFSSYPPNLDDTPALLMETHNLVLIDLDNDQEYALDLVESLVAAGPASATVMVYSKTTDPELLMRCMRAGAREFLIPPFVGSKQLLDSLERAASRQVFVEQPVEKSTRATSNLLTFMGAKGGTGVTTLACNFAVALAQDSSKKTLIIDLDLPLGDVALILGITPEYTTFNAFEASERLDANLLQSLVVEHQSGLFVLAASGKLNLHQATTAEINKLMTVAQQAFDNVVVDIGNRFDLTDTILFQNPKAVYLVTQAGIPELRNANRLISEFFTEDGSPRLEIIVNRHEESPFGISDSHITRALTRNPSWKIPNDYSTVRQTQINGVPLALANSPISREIHRMAKSLNGEAAEREKKRAFNLFG
jgi:pilus assembly protein CpaE